MIPCHEPEKDFYDVGTMLIRPDDFSRD